MRTTPGPRIRPEKKKMWLRIQQKKKKMWPRIWQEKKKMWPRIRQRKKKRAGIPANLWGCEFDKQT